MEYTLEELREMAKLTEQIKANIETINDDCLSDDDLNELLTKTGAIVANLEAINEAA